MAAQMPTSSARRKVVGGYGNPPYVAGRETRPTVAGMETRPTT